VTEPEGSYWLARVMMTRILGFITVECAAQLLPELDQSTWFELGELYMSDELGCRRLARALARQIAEGRRVAACQR